MRLLRATACLGMVTGCSDEGADGGPATQHGVRVVSLSPGVTATVVAIGAGDLLVGRTPWCVGVDSVPVVGTLLDFHAERLASVSPTVILVQPPAQGLSDTLGEFAARRRWTLSTHQLESIDDVRRLIHDLPRILATDASDPRAGAMETASKQLAQRLDDCLTPLPGTDRLGRTLALLAGGESPDALAFGDDTYLAQAIGSMGVKGALGRPGYPALSLEAILAIHPDTVLVVGSRSAALRDRLAVLMPGARLISAAHRGLLQPGGGLVDGLTQLRRELAEALR